MVQCERCLLKRICPPSNRAICTGPIVSDTYQFARAVVELLNTGNETALSDKLVDRYHVEWKQIVQAAKRRSDG